MADVMARGHGGDGAEDPPPPVWRGGGHHEADLIPRRKTRGKAKNLNLEKMINEFGGPLPLTFDTEATFTPVGEPSGALVREIGIYMWASIPLDKSGWNKVHPSLQAALLEHLKGKFDIAGIEHNPLYMSSLYAEFQRRYRSRKSKAKIEFVKRGGYEDVPRVLANPPSAMDPSNWRKVVEFFLSDAHKNRSQSNKECRAQQLFPNRGGSNKFSNLAFKEKKSRVDVFKDVKTKKDGTFDDQIIEQQYLDLQREYEECIQAGGTPNEVAIFRKVLGPRRGHIKGIGPQVSQLSSRSFDKGQSSSTSQSRHKKKDVVDKIAENSSLRAKFLKFLRTVNTQENDDDDDDEDEDEDDDQDEALD